MRATVPVRAAALVATATLALARHRVRARCFGASTARALRLFQAWSRRAWRWLRLDVRVEGSPPAAPVVYVANHRSYLDIPILSGALGASFLSRADVAQWPVVGAAAHAVGVVFVEREATGGRVRAARALARCVRRTSMIVFPEGTTGGGPEPGPFHTGVFRLLHRLGATVVPVTVRYGDRRAYWIDDVPLGRHLRTRVLAGPRLAATVHVGAPLPPQPDGESLARAAHAAVARPLVELGELVRDDA